MQFNNLPVLTMNNFCTYFDKNYLHRGLALYQSLLKHSETDFTLWIICLDDKTFDLIVRLNYKGIIAVHLKELEKGDDGLANAKKNRNFVEYYWTLTPSIPLYIFRTYNQVDRIVYIDADMYFFSSPDAIFKELGDSSILIVPHDYSNDYRTMEHMGKYNVGTMAFRSDARGLICLEWWRDRCLEWCYNRQEDGKFGDQGYLNDWPERFEGVVVSRNTGLRPAPWNISKYQIFRDSFSRLMVDDVPLICYHFHATKFCLSWFAFIASWPIEMSREWRDIVYRPYLQAIKSIENDLLKSGYPKSLPTIGFPWKYICGRIFKRQPIRHFMVVKSKHE